MATTSRKDNHFLIFFTCLLSSLELASVKYLETRHSCENDFGKYFKSKKMTNSSKGFLKIIQFPTFDDKKEILR